MCEDTGTEMERAEKFQKPFNKSFSEFELCAEGIFPSFALSAQKLINYVSKTIYRFRIAE